MKVCIVGKDSYIGNHIDDCLTISGHEVYQLDVLNENWRKFDFATFDAIVHVAGIVHRPKCKDANLYKMVNTDLPIEIAERFKLSGPRKKTFVFLSTMAVFGVAKRLQKNVIDSTTPTSPKGLYAMSKLEAENSLTQLQDIDFKVIIVRPPNVYGKGCKGGYIPGFAKITRLLPVIPEAYVNIKQSMLYIDNLCELIIQLIVKGKSGIFMPQDEKSVSAVEIMLAICAGKGQTKHTSKLLGMIAKLCSFLPIIQKAYGGVEYASELSDMHDVDYQKVSFEDAMKLTIG